MLYDENNNYFELENNFENNKYFNNYNNLDINIDNITFKRNDNLFTPIEGFNKGNMFSNMYSKYKNHVYKIKVNGEKDNILYKMQMYNFAMKDMNLYLDIYPDDKNILKQFYEYKEKYNELKNKYEYAYGPLNVNDVISKDKWTWVDNPWPWDKGDN